MPKDISADKRYQMGLTIGRKENEIDELAQEKRSFERQQEHFQANIHRNFQQSASIYEKMGRSGNKLGERELEVEYDMERSLNQTIGQHYEEFDQYYRQKRNQLEDDIDQLHRERNALPWD